MTGRLLKRTDAGFLHHSPPKPHSQTHWGSIASVSTRTSSIKTGGSASRSSGSRASSSKIIPLFGKFVLHHKNPHKYILCKVAAHQHYHRNFHTNFVTDAQAILLSQGATPKHRQHLKILQKEPGIFKS